VVLGSDIEGIPLLDDLRDNLSFPHSGELMLVLVVLLARKFTINLTQQLLLLFLSHQIQKLNYILLTASVRVILYKNYIQKKYS
jgi:hypothetical protein